MARPRRIDIGGEVYHILNRAVGRRQIFSKDSDYEAFIRLLFETAQSLDMRIFSFTIMPNHWHLQLWSKRDGDLALFMHALTSTHSHRVREYTQTVGLGPIYQGRYKSFLTESDNHFLTVFKYVERNPVRAGLVKKVEDWKWGSAYMRINEPQKARKLLTDPIVDLPANYLGWLNAREPVEDLDRLRKSVRRNSPFGKDRWVNDTVEKYGIISTLRKPGRPRKNSA